MACWPGELPTDGRRAQVTVAGPVVGVRGERHDDVFCRELLDSADGSPCRVPAGAGSAAAASLAGSTLISVLWTSLWMACAKWEQSCVHTGESWGFPAAAGICKEAAICMNLIHALWTKERVTLSTCHAAMTHR